MILSTNQRGDRWPHQADGGNGLSANWHVRREDRARLRAELAELDARLNELDQRRREAFDRQRYGRSAENRSTAADDLENLVAEMDRVMTRSRAVEGKLLLLQKMARKSDDGGGPPRDRPGRVRVEVYRGPAGTKMNG